MMKIVARDIPGVDVEYFKNLHKLHSDLPFLPERMKMEKVKKICLYFRRQKKLCRSHKSFKTGIKSRVNTKKST